MKLIKRIAVIAIPTLVTSLIGTFITISNMNYSDTIEKPSYYPPGWLFGAVWTAIFIVMTISAVIALGKANRQEREDIQFIYNIQLILNMLWSVLFFGSKMPWLAFAELLVLTLAIVVMMIKLRKADKMTALLQIPYLLWVLFAGFFLNLPIAVMN